MASTRSAGKSGRVPLASTDDAEPASNSAVGRGRAGKGGSGEAVGDPEGVGAAEAGAEQVTAEPPKNVDILLVIISSKTAGPPASSADAPPYVKDDDSLFSYIVGEFELLWSDGDDMPTASEVRAAAHASNLLHKTFTKGKQSKFPTDNASYVLLRDPDDSMGRAGVGLIPMAREDEGSRIFDLAEQNFTLHLYFPDRFSAFPLSLMTTKSLMQLNPILYLHLPLPYH